MSTQRRRLNRVRAVAQLLAFACAVSVAGSTAALAHATVPAGGHATSIGALGGVSDAAGVTTRDACAAPTPGHASCLAQRVVVASTGSALVAHPRRAGRAGVVVRSSPLSSPLAASSARAASLASASEPAASAAPASGTPLYLQQAYDLTALAATAGAGTTVAIVDSYNDPSAESDLAYYRNYFGLPACGASNGCFRVVGETGSSSLPLTTEGGWQEEETLDIEAVSALCPNCHILLVEANSSWLFDLEAAEQSAVAEGATIISNSWSGSGPVGTISSGDFSFAGVAVLAASGDLGWDTANTNTAWPAALASVNAIGGTTLSASTTARGFTESAWSGSGSGCANLPKPSYQNDTGCTGRAYSDISADADPHSGLLVYDGGWGVWGGTSLATPLTAAYFALVGGSAGQGNAAWDYAQGALLNDPIAGNNSANGACTPSYACNAALGYDGPTGAGSISGDVVAGAPGIGGPDAANGYLAAETATTATLTAGIYANGEATSYYVEYGLTAAYGQRSASVGVGSGAALVAATTTLAGLTPGGAYHYRLVAVNASGTTYGYDETLAAGPPAVTITAGPPASSTATSAVITYGESGTVTATACSLDGSDVPCSSTSASLSGLTLGSHTFVVEVTGAGGSGSALAAFAVSANPPAVTITGGPSTGSSATAASVSYSESGSVTATSCELDSTPLACSSSSANLTGLAVGSHTFLVAVSGPGGSSGAGLTFDVTAAANPRSPSSPPALSGALSSPMWSHLSVSPNTISACRKRARSCVAAHARFRFTLSVQARVTITLSRDLNGRQSIVGTVTVSENPGSGSYTLGALFGGHVLSRGSYTLSARAVTEASAAGAQKASAAQEVSPVFRAALRFI